MHNGPKFKICRRLGPGVYDKCQSPKFVASQAKKAPPKRGKTLSDFALQMIEKQRVRFSYGITERQFGNYVQKAIDTKGAPTAVTLFEKLEMRLDNVVYRLGLASSRALARQMVSHGHFVVNGTRTKVPSYALTIGDVVSVREGSKGKALFLDLDKKLKQYATPNWLSFNVEKMEGKVEQKPKQADEILNLPAVLEFYSR